MKIETLNLHKYDFISKKDFFFEIENEIFMSYSIIQKEDISNFYKMQFYDDFTSILNNLVLIDRYSSINFYISSIKKTIVSIKNKIIAFNLFIDKISYNIYNEIVCFSSSCGNIEKYIEIKKEQKEINSILEIDILETVNLDSFFRNLIDCFSFELDEFLKRINEQLFSLKEILYNSPPIKLKIPYNILIAVFTFLIEKNLLKLETGENVNGTLAAYILPQYFLIEKGANEPFAEESLRKQLSMKFEKHKTDTLIQNLYNLLCKYTGNEHIK